MPPDEGEGRLPLLKLELEDGEEKERDELLPLLRYDDELLLLLLLLPLLRYDELLLGLLLLDVGAFLVALLLLPLRYVGDF